MGSRIVIMQSSGANVLAMEGRLGEAIIDADGAFEFTHVPPGVYGARVFSTAGPATTVAVTVDNWDVSGVEIPDAVPVPRSPPPGNLSTAQPFNQPAPPERQPPSYAAGVRVSGRVTAPPDAPAARLPRAVALFGAREGLVFEGVINPDGSFQLTGVPPGAYEVRTLPLSMTAPGTRVVVNANDVTGLSISAPLEVEIRGQLGMADGTLPASGVEGMTVHLNFDGGSVACAVQTGSSFSGLLTPGDYTVSLTGIPPGLAIDSITTATGANPGAGPLRVGSTPVAIRIILTAAAPAAGRKDIP